MSRTSIPARPIFIVGAARSGTTLLQYMLRSHPNISLPTAESHFFIPFYRRREEFGDLTVKRNLRRLLIQIYDVRKSFFDDDFHGIRFDPDTLTNHLHEQQCTTIPEVIAGLFEANAHGEGKKRWGDKTPYYVLHLPTLLKMFPNARIIHVIRDGRDCCLSMLDRKRDLQIFNTYHAAYTWNKYVKAGQDFGKDYPDSYLGIKYEDVLNHPEQTMSSLCNFIEEPYDRSIIEFKKSKAAGKTNLLQKPLQKDNKEKWRDRMSIRQIRIFEAVAGDTLTQANYELFSNPHSLPPWEWICSELHLRFSQRWHKFSHG